MAMAAADEDAQHQAVLVFSAPIVKELISDEVRLPPNYVGVRKIRPSTFEVRNEFRGSVGGVDVPKTEVVYKVFDENGNERRMNSQEKKKVKLKLRLERAEERKKRKREAAENSSTDNNESAPLPSQHLPLHEASPTNSRYHQLEISKSVMEEELADLRGDRDGVPPVMLSPPLAKQALQSGVLPSSSFPCEQSVAFLDDDLANRWAEALKISMISAEQVRGKEDMRPMPYQLTPEVWTRLRPKSLASGDHHCQNHTVEMGANVDGPAAVSNSNRVWSFVTIRSKQRQIDSDTDVVISTLHHHSNLHVSCGAKFGCDFLIYDGRRDQRHAFAGLRIMERSSGSQLPLPSTYDLTGYVRCLNTAGKLALLATVERDDSCIRVAIVDLALEKIISPSKDKKSRREVGKNLGKHKS